MRWILVRMLEIIIYSGSTVFIWCHCFPCRRTSMTVLIFIARAFIAGGFQAAYVYTPEVRCQLR